jgi:hypothetical protein
MIEGNGNPSPAEALDALRARGVRQAADQLDRATPAEILTACHRWDREQDQARQRGKDGPGSGVIVHWIRSGQFTEPESASAVSKAAQLRARLAEAARQFPPGTVVESHRDMLARRWPEDLNRAVELDQTICDGQIVVATAIYPVLELECDACGFAAGLPPRSLHVLPSRSTPFPSSSPEAW